MTVMTRRASRLNIGLRSPTSAIDVSRLTTPDPVGRSGAGAAESTAASGVIRYVLDARLIWTLCFKSCWRSRIMSPSSYRSRVTAQVRHALRNLIASRVSRFESNVGRRWSRRRLDGGCGLRGRRFGCCRFSRRRSRFLPGRLLSGLCQGERRRAEQRDEHDRYRIFHGVSWKVGSAEVYSG